MDRTDAVVVGAGPNGLAAALTLAREGFRVTVLEASDEPGGGTRTYEDPDHSGVLHDHCAAVHPSGVGSPFLRTLPLERFGLEWCQPPIALAHPFADGSAAVLHRDLDATVESLGADGATWRRLVGPAVTHFHPLMREMLRPVLRAPRHPGALVRAGIPTLLPATAVAGRFPTSRGAGLFAGIAAHSMTRLDRPLSAAVGVMLGAAAHTTGWPVARGGSQGIWRSMVAYLEHLGGEVHTGVRVRTLGDLPPARVALFDVTPPHFAAIAGESLPRRIRSRARQWEFGPGAYKVDFVVEGPVPWQAEEARNAGTLHLCPDVDELVASEAALVRGEDPGRAMVLVAQPHVADSSREVAGLTPLWTYTHVPHGSGRDVTSRIEAEIERFAPGFSARIVARRVTRPADFEALNPNLVGGDIAGGANGPWQLAARPKLSTDPYWTGVPGAFLCSSSTAPGAGVHGMCGHHAAKSALRVLTA